MVISTVTCHLGIILSGWAFAGGGRQCPCLKTAALQLNLLRTLPFGTVAFLANRPIASSN